MAVVGAQVNKSTLKTINVDAEKKANNLLNLVCMCQLKLLVVVNWIAEFVYGILTLPTRPAIEVTRSEDDTFRVSMKIEKFLRLKIQVKLANSMQQSYLSTDTGYSFALKGFIDNSSIKKGSQTGNISEKSLEDRMKIILEDYLKTNEIRCGNEVTDNDKDNDSLLYPESDSESIYEDETIILRHRTDSTVINQESRDVNMNSTHSFSEIHNKNTEKDDSSRLNEISLPEIKNKHAERARRLATTMEGNAIDRRDDHKMNNNGDEHGNNISSVEANSDTCSPKPVRSTFVSTQHTTFSETSFESFERRKMKTSRIKKDTKWDKGVERVKNLHRDSKIRRYAEESFLSKQMQVEPHVSWPSMHPLVPYKGRWMEDRRYE